MATLLDHLSSDHERLDALLDACLRDDGSVDEASYVEFRRGLLRHIWIEERVLFPELRKQHREPELEQQLHRDHAALSALLVPPPTAAELGQIREILSAHNPLEEGAGGLYAILEELSGSELDGLMERVHAVPEVRVAPHTDSPLLRSTIAQLVREAEEGRGGLSGRS